MSDALKTLYPGCLLRQGKDVEWYFANQISTYELIIKLCRQCEMEDRLNLIYQKVKNNPDKYGRYAGLDNWSPVFTEDQLEALVGLFS